MNNTRKTLGISGEQQIVHYLQAQGFTIVTQNYTVRGGEIDVIAQKDKLLVFVEVKTRKNTLFDLTYVITPRKQRKIIYAARHYISTKGHHNSCSFRFDVALVEYSNNAPHITYIPDAFCDQRGNG